MIAHKHKCFFIHIPKTAGTSIEWILDGKCTPNDNGHHYLKEHFPEMADERTDRKKLQQKMALARLKGQAAKNMHLTAKEYRRLYPKEFAEFFKFSFVRNPWDRIVSAYHANIQGTIRRCKAESFEDFLRNFQQCVPISTQALMKTYLCDSQGISLVDFVGRYERLEEDWDYVCNRLKIRAKLPELNVTEHSDYKAYYTEETRRIVENIYAKDIAFFGYGFEGDI